MMKPEKIHRVWSYNGDIYYKKNDAINEPKIKVVHFDDVDGLFDANSNSSV